MRDEDKTKEQLITQLHELRQRLAESEKDQEELRRSQATKESEARFRMKVDNIFLPEGATETMELSDIIDAQEIQPMMDDFYDLTNIGIAILDVRGKILVATGWQDVCTKFHRIHPETSKNCLESDIELSDGAESGTFRLYQCKNNMWDMSTPITVGGKRVGNLYLGQFFFADESLDMDLFRSQALRYGFDEKEYLAAVERAPRWNRDTVNRVMSFYTKLAHLISELSYGNVKLAQTLTEKDQFLESLRQSEENFRRLFESINDAVFVHLLEEDGSQGRFIEVNEVACQRLGYSRQEILQLSPTDIGTAEGKTVATEIGNKLLDEGNLLFETIHVAKDGRRIPVENHLRLFDHHGQWAVLSISRDISERKRAEVALSKSEARYRKLVENANSIILRMDTQGTINFFNEFAQNFFGFPKDEILGQKVVGTIVPETETTGRDLSAMILDIGKNPHRFLNNENENTRKNRERVWIAWTNKAILDSEGRISEILCVGNDITERKRVEEALRESEERLRSILDATPSPIAFVDEQDNIIYFWNSSALTLFGHTASTATEWYQIAYPDPDYRREVLDRWRPFVEKARLSGQAVNAGEYQVTCRNGSVRICELYPAFRADKLIVTFYDITERKRAEEEKQRLEAQLRQAQKMEAVGTLAGGIAHEFNNILGIILGYAELAKDDIPEWNPARFNLDEIKAASLRAKGVVRQLLAFSRKTEENHQPLNLDPVVKEAIKFLRSSIPTNIEIRQNIAEGCHKVIADPTQIHQIILNLSTNAAHAMEEMGDILEFSLQNITLDESTRNSNSKLQPGKNVLLEVSDKGSGIPAEILDRIFDPYFTTKEVGKGTGMGLAVVHGIVEAHGGCIQVQSDPGRGTMFKIFFPATKEENRSALEIEEDLPTGNERILFIDDEQSIATLGRLVLEGLGYQVQAETNPTKALEVFASNPEQFDLIITDTTMPGITGDQLLKKVLQIRPDMKTILCTGYSERVDEEKAIALGAKAYALKPLDRKQLAITVREILDS